MEGEKVQQPNPTPITEETHEQPKPKKSSRTIIILLVIITILSLCLSGYLAYQNAQLRKEADGVVTITETVDIPTSPTTEVEILSPTPNPTVDWEIYNNDFIGYSIKRPQNWNVSLETSEEPFRSSKLVVSKDNYGLHFSTTQAGYGGVICKFNDSTDTTFSGPGTDTLYNHYTLEKFSGKEARRNREPISNLSQYGYQKNELDYAYRVCIEMGHEDWYVDDKKAYEGTIKINENIMEIVYYTPRTNINKEYLNTLDQILSTFKFTE